MLCAAAPFAYYFVAIFAAFRFLLPAPPAPSPEFVPAVSVLKPVRGVDFGSYENFASFCRQDYPEFELLFAVNDLSDPAVPLIRRLIAEYPDRRIRLYHGSPRIGSNGKINKLVRLLREARHEIVVISDGDVRVGPRYLRHVVAPFRDARTGLVTCLYRGVAQSGLFAKLEAVGASSDFFAGVLVARAFGGMRFALGATMVTTKSWLAKIGGAEVIADAHSDDYELGHRIYLQGGAVVLSREAVWTMYPATGLRGFWDHQLRWARTVRLCSPASYVGLLFTHGLPWALAGAALAPSRALAAAFLLGYLALRLPQAWVVGVRATGDDVLRRNLWLVPLRDALNFAVWIASFFSNRITWAGDQFEARKGSMAVVEDSAAGSVAAGRPGD